jgi:hypothetical protein
MMEANIASAKKFDAGEISERQFLAVTQALGNEFEAKNDEGWRNWDRQQRQEQCNKLFQQWITPGLEAVALEKLRNLGCLR